MVKAQMFNVSMLKNSAGEEHSNPGVVYAEYTARLRTKVDFSKFNVIAMRVVVSAIGNDAGAGKGCEIYDVGCGKALCEVVWNGNANQDGLAGSWTSYPYTTGTADSGSTTTTVDAARTEVEDYWNNCMIRFTGGPNIGLSRLVTNFEAGPDRLTHDAFPDPVAVGHTYELTPVDSVITIRTKGVDAAEDITYYVVDFQVLYC